MRAHLACLLVLLAGLMTISSGCLAVAVGAGAAGAVAYVEADLETEEPYNIEQTYSAARKAAEDLGLNIIEGETGQDAMSAHIVARDSADKRVAIKLKAITSNATKLSVRVGTFGDNRKENRIYNAIRENLKIAAGTPPDSSTQVSTSLQLPVD